MLADVVPPLVRVGVGPADAGRDGRVDGRTHLRGKGPAGDDAAERDGQPGGCLPPGAQVLDTVQAALLVGEAAFMDDHAAVHLAADQGVHDPVKTHHHQVAAARAVEAQQQDRGGVLAGDGDPPLLHGSAAAAGGDQQGPAAAPQGRAGLEQGVAVEHVAERVAGDLAHIHAPGQGPGVQGFHVLQHRLGKGHALQVDAAVHQGVEDVGVVGTGRKAQGQGGGVSHEAVH